MGPPVVAGLDRHARLAVRERIAGIVAREGAFRVPKDAGCFVADVSPTPGASEPLTPAPLFLAP